MPGYENVAMATMVLSSDHLHALPVQLELNVQIISVPLHIRV